MISESKWNAMRGEVTGGRGTWLARAARLGIAAAAVLIFAVLPLHAQTEKVRPAGAGSSAKTLADLPPAALPAISSALGHDDARYAARKTADGYSAQNAANHLAAHYSAKGVGVRSQNANLGFEFQGWGYGEHPANKDKAAVAPRVNANRVEYRRGALTEWYVNGPLGIEQGFTISRPPVTLPDSSHGALDIALRLRGNLSASIEPGRHALVLRDQKGAQALRYGPLLAYDASGRELESWMEVQDGHLRLRVNTAGARYPIIVDPWVQAAKLTNSTGLSGDYFGTSVAISGNTVVVGAYAATIGGTAYQGAVYVFVEPTPGGWATTSAPTAVLNDPNATLDDQFGYSVAISGNTIVTSAVQAQISYHDQGAVYVFTAPTVNGAADWSSATMAQLTASDAAPAEELGNTVAINETGNTIVAGALDAQVGNNVEQGEAYVFDEPTDANGVPTGWVTKASDAELFDTNGEAHDLFGDSVAISGNTVAVGARVAGTKVTMNNETLAPGAAYVFVGPASGVWPTTPAYNAKLTTAGGGVAGDSLGDSVAIRGNTVVASAPGAVAPGGSKGVIEVFVEPTDANGVPTGWISETENADLTASNAVTGNIFLGSSVSINETGDTVVAGADNTTITVGSKANLGQGAAFVFDEPTPGGVPTWTSETETAQFTSSDGAAADLFGISVGISGNTIVAGASGVNTNHGAAYVFTLVGGEAISAISGSGQTTAVNTTFSAPLVAQVLNGSTGVSGITVTFTAPASGASGTFANDVNTAVTDSTGTATSAAFTANATGGPYTVTATAPGASGAASFMLTNKGGPIATTTAITSSTSSFHGFPLPANYALVGVTPVTVDFTVTQASGSVSPTGTVVVNDGFGDTCTTTTLNSGNGSCTFPTIPQLGNGTTMLTATYTISTNGFSASPPSNGFTENLVGIFAPCAAYSDPAPVKSGTTITTSLTVCVAGSVTPQVLAVTNGCIPRGKCTYTITPIAGEANAYTVSVTIVTTDAGAKGSLPNAVPRRGPWLLTVFEFVALLALLLALQLTWQKQTRLRLSSAAGLLCVLLLGGMSSCNGPSTSPPGTYTINITLTEGQYTFVMPIHVTLTQ